MLEVRYILPKISGLSGIALPHVHDTFREACIDIAGGVTVTSGEGYWRAPNGETMAEPVNVYTVALATPSLKHPANYQARNLRKAAIDAAKALGQTHLYARDCLGEVEILEV